MLRWSFAVVVLTLAGCDGEDTVHGPPTDPVPLFPKPVGDERPKSRPINKVDSRGLSVEETQGAFRVLLTQHEGARAASKVLIDSADGLTATLTHTSYPDRRGNNRPWLSVRSLDERAVAELWKTLDSVRWWEQQSARQEPTDGVVVRIDIRRGEVSKAFELAGDCARIAPPRGECGHEQGRVVSAIFAATNLGVEETWQSKTEVLPPSEPAVAAKRSACIGVRDRVYRCANPGGKAALEPCLRRPNGTFWCADDVMRPAEAFEVVAGTLPPEKHARKTVANATCDSPAGAVFCHTKRERWSHCFQRTRDHYYCTDDLFDPARGVEVKTGPRGSRVLGMCGTGMEFPPPNVRYPLAVELWDGRRCTWKAGADDLVCDDERRVQITSQGDQLVAWLEENDQPRPYRVRVAYDVAERFGAAIP